MTQWDRVNAMQLEVATLHARVRRMIDQVHDAQVQLIMVKAALEEATEARDLARRVAIRLEQENHALAGSVCALCAGHIVPVHVVGDAT
jgi:hypothetical protein